ncbi:MAG: ABC transporter ATP-binding protein [Planctomycetaceae bacterium]
MTHPAIRVEQIGKRYQLGLREKANQTFREAVVDMASAPLRRLKHLSGRAEAAGAFWALRDISFDVPEGEVLGIIGHNGAGKSTLLKILSRITEPTEGRAVVRGRVASLLEVGTGFHNELTGRENVYLNGAILGMSKADIDRKFDEIVDFAGVERFLDTAIKHYSSGMKVRLAFAVAAHLEPEILIIDEVLAVGDQEFQNKCLGKMNEVATSGRTVFFVSHNMPAVEALCESCLLLSGGRVLDQGAASEIVSEYLRGHAEVSGDVLLVEHSGRHAAVKPVITRMRVVNQDGVTASQIGLGEDVHFEVDVAPDKPLRYARLAIRFFNSIGQRIVTCHSEYQHPAPLAINECVTVRCTMHDCRMAPGRYTIALQLDEYQQRLDFIESACSFDVVPRDIYGTGRTLPPNTAMFFPHVEWQMVNVRQEGSGRLSAPAPLSIG